MRFRRKAVPFLTLAQVFRCSAPVLKPFARRVEASYSGRGPGHYPVLPMLFAMCMMPILGLGQRNLDRILYVGENLAGACGFAGQTPVQSTFSRFIHR